MRQIRVLLLMSLVGCVHRRSDPFAELQTLTPVSFRGDSAVLARLGRQQPCVTRVPRLSHLSDDIAPPKACILIETAVAAIRDLKGTPEVLPDLREFRIERVRCATVTQSAYRNDFTGEIELARWSLEFHSEEQPNVAVVISRLTGESLASKELDDFGAIAEGICD